jgi:hypothetical protein
MDHFVIDLLKLQQKADYFMHIIVHENGTPVFEFTTKNFLSSCSKFVHTTTFLRVLLFGQMRRLTVTAHKKRILKG